MMYLYGRPIFWNWFLYTDGLLHRVYMAWNADTEVIEQMQPSERTICNKILPYSAVNEMSPRAHNIPYCEDCIRVVLMMELAE